MCPLKVRSLKQVYWALLGAHVWVFLLILVTVLESHPYGAFGMLAVWLVSMTVAFHRMFRCPNCHGPAWRRLEFRFDLSGRCFPIGDHCAVCDADLESIVPPDPPQP